MSDFSMRLQRRRIWEESLVLELQELITNKNTFGVQKLLSDKEISESQKNAFASLTGLFGAEEVLTKARALTDNVQAAQALDRLQEIWDTLKLYGVSKYVSFDLGMLSHYMYYTGIIFCGYTYGTGDAVIKGGRYDGLLSHFGKNAPGRRLCSGDRPAFERAFQTESDAGDHGKSLHDPIRKGKAGGSDHQGVRASRQGNEKWSLCALRKTGRVKTAETMQRTARLSWSYKELL